MSDETLIKSISHLRIHAPYFLQKTNNTFFLLSHFSVLWWQKFHSLAFSVYSITSSGIPPISVVRWLKEHCPTVKGNFKSNKYSKNYVFRRTCLWVSLVCTTELQHGICFSVLDFCVILSQARRLSDAKIFGKTKSFTFTFERWQCCFPHPCFLQNCFKK